MSDVLLKVTLALTGLFAFCVVAWLFGRFAAYGVLRSIDQWRSEKDEQEERQEA